MKEKILGQILRAKIVIHEKIRKPMLFLDIALPESTGTSQYLPLFWVETLMKDYKVDDLSQIKGKPIWVESEGVGSAVTVIGAWSI